MATLTTGGEIAVAPSGDLDLDVADAFARDVRRLELAGRRLVVDLGGVAFLDSAGLSALMALRNDAKRNRHELVLVAGPPAVQRIFQLTGTRGLFDWREP